MGGFQEFISCQFSGTEGRKETYCLSQLHEVGGAGREGGEEGWRGALTEIVIRSYRNLIRIMFSYKIWSFLIRS